MAHKILFVVAHPDDESLWIGGILNFLSNREEVEPYVLCATGRHHPERYKEFESVMNLIGINNWYVGDEDIPERGGIPLHEFPKSFVNGLESLELNPEDIDVIITHPFHGDEHLNGQHAQLFAGLFYLCKDKDVPFGFFSTVVIRYYSLKPLLMHMKRDGGTHLINYSSCESIPHTGYGHHIVDCSTITPEYFYQFKVDSKIKSEMLSLYKSINQEEHQKGYASWDSDVEGVYFMSAKAASPFLKICDNMDVPAGNPICGMPFGS